MKRSLFIAVLGVLCASSACTVVIDDVTSVENSVIEEVVITATHELDSQTKTVLKEDGSVWWKPGDAIGVFFGPFCSEFYAYNSVDAPSAKFIGNALIVDGHNENSNGNVGEYSYWGVFPPKLHNNYTQDEKFNYSRGNEDYEAPTRNGESVNVYLPSRQRGVAGTFDYNNFISIAKSNDYKELSFYNLCGGLAFCVENEGISKVTFAGNDGEVLAGQVNVVMNSDGHPVVNEVINGKTEVTLAMKDGESFIPGEWYYIVMLPTTLEKGYTMTFNGHEVVSNTPVEIRRSVFGRLTNPDAYLLENFVQNIYIDGILTDWDALPSNVVSVATCDPDTRLTALKTLKAYSDEYYLYLYVEFEDDEVVDRSYAPFQVFINADNSNHTGGFEGDYWNYAYIDYMLEGVIFVDNDYSNWDPGVFKWWGGIGDSGWYWTDPSVGHSSLDNWGAIIGEGSGVASSAGNGNAFEIAIIKDMISVENFASEFTVGVVIQQSWNTVGCLPNAASTDLNPSGNAQMLTIVTY